MTSIEWLDEQITICFENYSGTTLSQRIYDKIEQAKEMHKAEIEDAFQDGKWDWNEHITNGTESKDLEQYYKETFKKDKL